ncbi:uncharacterized protein N7477_001085 [Penicillium maclennaniae]|uniref:uncharacterized protein n=1 Tax=Penicillium maclennaniae TaxID=1343394 RepID=UPI0025411F6B|nr:uncharacterized protein N7477_001085 [Penicillium maclennaniae]KAJ5684740.1 hypothetical protein N7477_001085 [Penicillium maclennaniae]
MEPLKKQTSQRLPPPALFQGPPSHNASNISLSVPPPASTLATPVGSRPPALSRDRSRDADSIEKREFLSPFMSRRSSKHEVDGSDAIWQEMQSALSEVELSAVTSDHVFGEKHAEALEDLRMKQLRLAQAWARSEADDEVVDSSHNTTEGDRRASSEAKTVDAATEQIPIKDHEETEKDINLARKRRDANDRYFDRVNQGVLDVVAKLEEVSNAMRTVERESKDIWSDSDSVTTEDAVSANAD